MATPDIRVRLSAEGVAEVVAALRTVQAEAAKASTKGGSGFLGLNRILGSTASLLQTMGVALGVRQLMRWVGSAVDAASQTLRLGTQVGATTEDLSALNLVARTSGISLDDLGMYLSRMNTWVGKVIRDTPAATATLRRLGLSLSDFKGKDAVQIFELIGRRITALPSPFERTAAAVDIFGRGAGALIPTMKALADEGLDRVKQRAEELGVLIDTDLALSARNLKRDFGLLKMQSEGLALQLAAGIGPGLSQSLQEVSGDLKQTKSAWREFGEGVGQTIKYIVAIVSSGFDIVGTLLGMQMGLLDARVRATVAFAKGHFAEAKRIVATAIETSVREMEALKKRLAGRWELATSPAPEGPPVSGGKTDEEIAADAEAAREQRLKAAQAALDRELSLVKTAATLKNQEEKRAFEQGLEGIKAYYANRTRIADDAYAAEVALLEKRRGLLADEPDPAVRAAEEAKIEDDLAKAKLENAGEIAAILGEEIMAVRDLGMERLALDQKILESEGERHAAAMLAIDEEIAKADLLLRKQGASDEERAAALARMRSALTASADFDETKRQADEAMASFETARAAIQSRMSAGLLSQAEGEQQILDIEKERITTLELLARGLEAAAIATGDPEKIAQARAFSASIQELGNNIASVDDSLTRFRTTAIDSATSALTTFLDTGINKSTTFKSAFKSMATSIVGDLRNLAAELIASGIMKWATGLFHMGGEVGAAPAAKAGGGLLEGSGTGISDSNLIRASRGEYLVREAVVSQPGVLEHLNALNARGVRALAPAPLVVQIPTPRFAEGGLVGNQAPDGGGIGKEGRLLIGLDDGLVLRYLESSAGQRIVVKTLSKNRRAVRSALGI